MRSAIAQRAVRMRSNSQRNHPLRTVPPPRQSDDYDENYAALARAILYQSPLLSPSGLPLYILNAAAFPDSFEVDYDSLLPYVLGRFPNEDDLIAGAEYEVVFFAGGQPDTATNEKKTGPGVGWYMKVYQVLSRALRKRLQKIWIVHERSWVRVLTEVFGTIVSPKFKRKVVHVSTLSHLAMHIPIENLLIPPAVYLHDRKLSPDIYVPYATGRRAFGANEPMPLGQNGERRLPRVLREATTFLTISDNIKTEGLFRIPPRRTTRDILREAYNRGQHFIIWGEGQTVFAEPLTPRSTLKEVPKTDVYGVHLAAGLVKCWYGDLRIPIFPEACYDQMMGSFDASTTAALPLQQLASLLSPQSESSVLSYSSRVLLTRHLLPLLATIASYESSNKMDPNNLAICFIPALIRGGDQMQEAKMLNLLRGLITRAIVLWLQGLSEACGCRDDTFAAMLAPPESSQDYEDPPGDMNPPSERSASGERSGWFNSSSVSSQNPPALPPRMESREKQTSPPKRKAAPAVQRNQSTPLPVATAQTFITPPTPESNKQKHATNARPTGKRKPHSLQLPQGEDAGTVKPGLLTPGSGPPSPLLGSVLAELENVRLRSASDSSAKSSDHVFTQPTWAASSRHASVDSGKSTPPLIVPKMGSDLTSRVDSGIISNGYNPKPRAPSPGLMARMQSWEKEAAESTPESRASNIVGKNQSVEDLRKLYEDRATTIASMPPMARTSSGASSHHSRGR